MIVDGNSGKIKIVRTKPRKPWNVEQAEAELKRKEKKLKKQQRKEHKRVEGMDS